MKKKGKYLKCQKAMQTVGFIHQGAKEDEKGLMGSGVMEGFLVEDRGWDNVRPA